MKKIQGHSGARRIFAKYTRSLSADDRSIEPLRFLFYFPWPRDGQSVTRVAIRKIHDKGRVTRGEDFRWPGGYKFPSAVSVRLLFAGRGKLKRTGGKDYVSIFQVFVHATLVFRNVKVPTGLTSSHPLSPSLFIPLSHPGSRTTNVYSALISSRIRNAPAPVLRFARIANRTRNFIPNTFIVSRTLRELLLSRASLSLSAIRRMGKSFASLMFQAHWRCES